MPTGVAIPDARALLFDAAERILLRDGGNMLTSRAVTTEAGVAKGVLHRHFEDFDTFLAELVLDRVGRMQAVADDLMARAGTGPVVDQLAAALDNLLGPIAVAIVGLVISRDGLRAALRARGSARIPVLGEATAVVARYLAAEQAVGRISPATDVDALAPILVGAVHMQLAEGAPVEPEALTRTVTAVVGGLVSA
ncbi:MAG: TetR family transcriptional regulator [Catenulispora sp.]